MAAKGKPRASNKRVRVKSSAAPLTPMQTHRARVLLDLGLRQADIITALGEKHPQNISGIFRDRFRSLGKGGLEARVVEFLRTVALERDSAMVDKITLDSMGWPQPSARNETPASAEAGAGES